MVSGNGRDSKREPDKDAPAREDTENPTDATETRFPIVGIGASAGGLEALRTLLSAMPPDTGTAFVLIQHLDAEHQSRVAELLSKYTTMPVVQVQHGLSVEPNHLYVIPPDTYLTLSDGVFLIKHPTDARGMRMPIDRFFCSLAADQQEQGIGIIVSGSGTDGSLGVREIKAKGGMVIVQDPETAQQDGMPRSAISTGQVDAVLPLEQMPAVLLNHFRHNHVEPPRQVQSAPETACDPLTAILSLLLAKTGHDFRCYKKGTLIRRIHRRMGITGVEHTEDYLNILRERDTEVRALSKDLFIGVTSFFREADAWDTIAKVAITPIVEAHTGEDPVRVWVPGCATGEEAYTLAILFAEAFDRHKKNLSLLIFATDVDQDALQVARAGLYLESISQNLSQKRLNQFFTKEGEGYRVKKWLRDLVVFTPQDLIAEPPFSKLNLISCRNLLIYLESRLQDKVLRLFHFALKPEGFLVLGSSETLGQNHRRFRTLSKKWRIFKPEGPSQLGLMEIPVARDAVGSVPRFLQRGMGRREPSLADMAQQALVETFAPASVLVTPRYQVLYVYGDTSDYLTHPPGELTDNLMAMTRAELRLKTRTALHQAIAENRQVTVQGAQLKQRGMVLNVAVTVTPLQKPPLVAGLLLVSFQQEPMSDRELEETRREAGAEAEMVRHLEEELKTIREDLQSTIEELETSNEELKASNEEVMSMNEELQSSNEELETSKEELHSLNEELTTVNNQLQNKMAEVEATNNDLANLLASANIATLFLDRRLRIKRFTPATTRLMNLIPSDVGRLVADIAHKYANSNLIGECQRVMEDLQPVEREIQSEEGDWYIRRVQPYRTQDNHIEGTVVTFTDVSVIKSREEEHALLAAIVESSLDAIIGGLTSEGVVTDWNPGAEEIFGYQASEMIGRLMQHLVPEDGQDDWACILGQATTGRRFARPNTKLLHKNGTPIRAAVTICPILDAAGRIIGVSAICRDVTSRLKAEEALKQSEAQLRSFVEQAPHSIAMLDRDLNYLAVSNHWIREYGRGHTDLLGRNHYEIHPDLPEAWKQIHRDALEGKFLSKEEDLWIQADGSHHWLRLAVQPWKDSSGAIAGIMIAAEDITRRKQAERALRESEADLNRAQAMGNIGSWRLDVCRDALTWSEESHRILGLPEGTQPTYDTFLSLLHPGDRDLVLQAWQACLQGEPHDIEHRLVVGGQVKWVRERAEPELDDKGEVLGCFGTTLDITERKRAEQALRKADRRKDEFLAILGHELRNPLMPIRNALGVVARVAEPLPEKTQWALDVIGRQSEHLERLVGDLLDVARITRGRMRLHKRTLDLRDVLRDALETTAPLVEQHGHHLQTRLPDEPILVKGDPVRLAQVISNLLSSAAKYTPEGGHIRVSLSREGQAAVVRAKDDGIGIPAEDRPRLFDSFVRNDGGAPDSSYPGALGLGLSLAHRLVVRHDGKLEAFSDGPGRGSEFVVTLPIVAEHEEPATPLPAAAPSAQRSRRILVVDDNPIVATSLRVLLETMGHEVRVLNGGAEVVGVVQQWQPAVVFMDIAMPDMATRWPPPSARPAQDRTHGC